MIEDSGKAPLQNKGEIFKASTLHVWVTRILKSHYFQLCLGPASSQGAGGVCVCAGALILRFLNSASFSVIAYLGNLNRSKRIIFREASRLLILLLCNVPVFFFK